MSRPLRPLLPHPPDPEDPPCPANRPSASNRKRQTVVAACEACRRRKSKCNVERPRCSACIARNTECEYDTNSSETHSQALKRKYDDLQQRKSYFEDVFEILKSKPDEEADSILARIRRGADAETIVRHVQNADLLIHLSITPGTRNQYAFPFIKEMPASLIISGNRYLDSKIYQATLESTSSPQQQSPGVPNLEQNQKIDDPDQGIYLNPYYTAEMIDERLSLVNVSVWTSVISDNELFGKLLGAYFLHEHPWSFFFHKDYFMADLVNGYHQHCSTLLVNAILAAACKIHVGIPERAEIWSPHNLGYKFLAEAKRLWELEEDRAKLTTIQAACIINLICNLDGVDRIGTRYLGRAMEMANEMEIFSFAHKGKYSESRVAREFTGWSLFNWQAMLSFYFRKPPSVVPPSITLPDLDEDSDWYGEISIQYSSDQKAVSTNFSHLVRHSLEFRVIMHDIADAAFQPSVLGKLSSDRTLDLISRTRTWFQKLPECLRPKNIITPAQLKLHMEYHYVTINILEPIVTEQHATTYMVSGQTAQEVLSLSLVQLETLVRLFYTRHGFEWYDPFLVQVLIFLGNRAVTDLASSPTRDIADALRSTAILCAKGLRCQSRNFYVAELVYRLLRSVMTVEDVRLLDRFVEPRGSAGNDLLQTYAAVQAEWPLPTTRIDEDPRASQLEILVRQYEQSSASSERGTESPQSLN